METAQMRWERPELKGLRTPTIKNHTATLVDGKLFVFGGYDGRRNHASLYIFDCDTYTWTICSEATGTPPAGRNGHTATLIDPPSSRRKSNEAGVFGLTPISRNRRILFLGGWLGSGPLAASDVHELDVDALHWTKPEIANPAEGPGPCNMHTADWIPSRRQVFVFRGGDGRNYLNDLHALHADTHTWTNLDGVTAGQPPLKRANHASAVDGHCLYIFGGWDGQKRLNDVHVLDTVTLTWSQPECAGLPLQRPPHASPSLQPPAVHPRTPNSSHLAASDGANGTADTTTTTTTSSSSSSQWRRAAPAGPLPHPRAGMTLTRVKGALYLFGGSGPGSKCFNDLQAFDPLGQRWIETHADDPSSSSSSSSPSSPSSSSSSSSSLTASAPPSRARFFSPPPFSFPPHSQLTPPTSVASASATHHHGLDYTPTTSLPAPSGPSLSSSFSSSSSPCSASSSAASFSPFSSNPNSSNPNPNDGSPTPPGRSRGSRTHRRNGREGGGGRGGGGGEEEECSDDDESGGEGAEEEEDKCSSRSGNAVRAAASILVSGEGPGRRAGHSATACGERKIIVFGGSAGSEYLSDLLVLDTDPPPVVSSASPSSVDGLASRLAHLFRASQQQEQQQRPQDPAAAPTLSPSSSSSSSLQQPPSHHLAVGPWTSGAAPGSACSDSLPPSASPPQPPPWSAGGLSSFADVVFVVGREREPLFAHRVLLSLLSEKFNVMFAFHHASPAPHNKHEAVGASGSRDSGGDSSSSSGSGDDSSSSGSRGGPLVVPVPHRSVACFSGVLEYLYSGTAPPVVGRLLSAYAHPRAFRRRRSYESKAAAESGGEAARGSFLRSGQGGHDDEVGAADRGQETINTGRPDDGEADDDDEDSELRSAYELCVELMECADEYMVDRLRECCEGALAHAMVHAPLRPARAPPPLPSPREGRSSSCSSCGDVPSEECHKTSVPLGPTREENEALDRRRQQQKQQLQQPQQHEHKRGSEGGHEANQQLGEGGEEEDHNDSGTEDKDQAGAVQVRRRLSDSLQSPAATANREDCRHDDEDEEDRRSSEDLALWGARCGTAHALLDAAERCNAWQLAAASRHLLRSFPESLENREAGGWGEVSRGALP